MGATVLDGTKIAAEIRGEVAAEVQQMAEAGVRPGLAVVLALAYGIAVLLDGALGNGIRLLRRVRHQTEDEE